MDGLPTAKRHAERSRSAILKAATELFAENGYAATTLGDVGRRAGLSRGTPAYFFGSKEGLYRQVLGQAFSEARESLLGARRRAEDRGLKGEAAFRHALDAYIDFLVERPDFVRLVEWEALGHGAGLAETAPHHEMVLAALEDIGDALRDRLPAGFDITQLMLSIAGLCWFPIAHRETLGKVLAADPLSPKFVAARKRHVAELVLRGIGGPGRREEK